MEPLSAWIKFGLRLDINYSVWSLDQDGIPIWDQRYDRTVVVTSEMYAYSVLRPKFHLRTKSYLFTKVTQCFTVIIIPRPHGVGALSVDGGRLSVHLSSPYVTLRQEWKRLSSWKLAGRSHDPIQRSKDQRSRSLGRLMLLPKISHILRTGRPMNLKLGIWIEYDDLHHSRARWPQR